jgi:predicted peptidase
MLKMAVQTLEESMKEFKGDPARVYLTGLSMGGYGTWALGAQWPGRFAALVPICGGVRLPPLAREKLGLAVPKEPADIYTITAQRIGGTPVWAFHGAADPIVPVTESRELVTALKAAGGNVRYTEYEGVGHDSWTKAYEDPELLTWLLAQRLELAR